MSLLTSFVLSHLVPALEAAFIAHEPDMQEALLKEVEDVAAQVGAWLASKAVPSATVE